MKPKYARACARTHTHTHTHAYIYIYIYRIAQKEYFLGKFIVLTTKHAGI